MKIINQEWFLVHALFLLEKKYSQITMSKWKRDTLTEKSTLKPQMFQIINIVILPDRTSTKMVLTAT